MPEPVLSPTRITLEYNEKIRPEPDRENAFARASGGWGGIRTHGALSCTLVFKTSALNHSATHPEGVVRPSDWHGKFQAKGPQGASFGKGPHRVGARSAESR